MEAVWKKESGLGGLDEVLQYYDTMCRPDAIRVFFTSNNDENSHSGSEYERMGDAAKAFAVLCCTGSGLPLIYSGQELPNLKRLLFFEKDFIEWTGGAGPGDPAEWAASCGLHDLYKTMLALRKRNPALRVADPSATTHRLHTRADDRSFVFARRAGENEVLVALNFSAEPLSLATEELLLNGGFQNVFTGEGVDFGPGKTIGLAPWGYGVFEKK